MPHIWFGSKEHHHNQVSQVQHLSLIKWQHERPPCRAPYMTQWKQMCLWTAFTEALYSSGRWKRLISSVISFFQIALKGWGSNQSQGQKWVEAEKKTSMFVMQISQIIRWLVRDLNDFPWLASQSTICTAPPCVYWYFHFRCILLCSVSKCIRLSEYKHL